MGKHDQERAIRIVQLAQRGLSMRAIADSECTTYASVRAILRLRGISTAAKSAKGHWPKGKTRSDSDTEEWIRVRTAVNRILARPDLAKTVSRTASGIAQYVGTDSKNVSRWLSGQRQPMEEALRKIRLWIVAVQLDARPYQVVNVPWCLDCGSLDHKGCHAKIT